MNRRSFLTIATLGIGALAVSSTVFAEERKRGGSNAKSAELVDENSDQAKALNYKSGGAGLEVYHFRRFVGRMGTRFAG